MTARSQSDEQGSSDATELRYRPGELAILFETVRDLTSTLSTHEVIQRLLGRLTSHLESEIASIQLVDGDQKLRIRHASGLPEDVMASAALSVGEGIAGYVAATGEPLLVEDVEADPRFRRRNHERYYTRSAISAPLRAHGLVIGVINVNNKRSREPYTQDDLRLIEAIAGPAAMALSNAYRYEETLELSRRDALTGLANHGHFWSTLRVEIERATRYRRSIGLVLLDIDHFKTFNDRLGHIRGDEALAQVARVISESSRAHDLPARYGGEEFAVILPEAGLEGASAFAEKIRQAVEGGTFPGTECGDVTISVGVAAYPGDADNPAALVEVADRRLYAAKDAGRNCVRSSD